MTRFDVARTQQPKSTAAYGSLRFGPLRYQLKRTIGMLPTPDNSECSRQTAITWTRLSCKRFRDNEVRLQLHALAYNLGVFLQGVDLPEEMADWSLTSIQSRLIKIGARVVRHARKITFQLAEVAVSGALFGQIITAIRNIKPPPGPA